MAVSPPAREWIDGVTGLIEHTVSSPLALRGDIQFFFLVLYPCVSAVDTKVGNRMHPTGCGAKAKLGVSFRVYESDN